ncbi:carboxypeptidase regulatory-like domain-containing protein [Plantactinospora sp. B5E13]|uniref:carboxypeptidase regulatory-like domain-containing protein n=1 Tax=unclassified Plantactinospora TaxID=2631981 RepID=UPI00325EDDDD
MSLNLLKRAGVAVVLLGATVLAGAPPAVAAATGTIAGHVTTAAGAPSAGTTVRLYPEENEEPLAETETDAAGAYRFDDLAAESYVLAFDPPDGPDQFHHQKLDIWEADKVAVTEGALTTVDEQLLPTGVITGRIRNAAGNGVPDLRIIATSADYPATETDTTDADGQYRIVVPAGPHFVSFQPTAEVDQLQYVPGKLERAGATRFEVPAGGEVVADDTALRTGSLTGRLTTGDGEPVVDAWVHASNAAGTNGDGAYTDEEGEFSIPRLLAGTYRVAFLYTDEDVQYYRGALDAADADPVVVQAEQETRITDSLVANGAVRVRAVDADTGTTIADFCVEEQCSDGTGSLTISSLPAEPQRFQVTVPGGGYFPASTGPVTPVPGETVEVTVKLQRIARITTTVVDRATGQPVAGVCLVAVPLRDPRLPDPGAYRNCSDSTGRAVVDWLRPGSYTLFADPVNAAGHGRQWVGSGGGTGDQRAAAVVRVDGGATVTGPTVRLDPAGTITGRVTDRGTGAPVAGINIHLFGYHPEEGQAAGWTGTDGRYQVTGLGPYTWPLFFHRSGLAGQWSGGVPDRHDAARVRVTAGGTSSYDHPMRAGVEVRGDLRDQDGQPIYLDYLLVHNYDSGDVLGYAEAIDGRYRLPVLGKQRIFFSYSLYRGGEFYTGPHTQCASTDPAGTDQSRPTAYQVPRSGTLTANLVVCTD